MTRPTDTFTIFVEVFFISYKDYQNARDAAWRILLDCQIDKLPVNLNPICKKLKVRLLSYDAATKLIERANLWEAVHHTDGLTFYMRRTPVILYDDTVFSKRAAFTIAHELGHVVLGHVEPGTATAINREPHPGDAPKETAANQFAARLLAPACVLWGLDIHTPEEIMELCQISRTAAEFRAQRMDELYQRNRFLTSPLERAVYQQFQPFIEKIRNPLRGG